MTARATAGRGVRTILIAAVAAALAGCSMWELGPGPDDYVGASRRGETEGRALTDPTLKAVRPVVPGDVGVGVIEMSPTTTGPATTQAVPGATSNPGTMPAATQPTTTSPAASTNPETMPSLGQGGAARSGTASVPGVLSVQEAILVGLQNSSSLRVQRYSVPIRRTSEEQAVSAFDPTISGTLQGGAAGASRGGTNNSITGNIGAQEFLPTGTTINAGLSTSNSFYNDAASSTGVTLSVTQSLLRGAGLDVNLATVRQSQIDTKVSQYELRGFAETLVADIESTYWDLVFAERQVLIVQNSLGVAEEQLANVNEQIRVGRVANTEQAAAEAEVMLRRQDLINAKSSLETTRIRLLQLITPPGEPFWDRTIELHTQPFVPEGKMDPVDAHVDVALRLRPEMNETRLEIQRGDLEVVRTRNGLLPRLDLFVSLGKTGFASSFTESIPNVNGPDYSAIVGVKGDFEPLNRAANASYRASLLSRDQQEETLRNLTQTVQVDVRTQYIEVERTRQQIDATRATRVAQQTAYDVEVAKFRANRSTSLLVAQALRDLLTAQLSEVQAVTNHLKALVTLYRLEGSLLYRRGLDAPGAIPVELSARR